jgi:hypothetical protein
MAHHARTRPFSIAIVYTTHTIKDGPAGHLPNPDPMSYTMYTRQAAKMEGLKEAVRKELIPLVMRKAVGETELEKMRAKINQLNSDRKNYKELAEFVNRMYLPRNQTHEATVAEWEKCNALYEALEKAMYELQYINDLETQANDQPLTDEEEKALLIKEAQETVDDSIVKSKIAPIEFESLECTDTKPSCLEGEVVTLPFNFQPEGTVYGRTHTTEFRSLVLILKRVIMPATCLPACVVCYFEPRGDGVLTFEIVEEKRLRGGPKDTRFMEKYTK